MIYEVNVGNYELKEEVSLIAFKREGNSKRKGNSEVHSVILKAKDNQRVKFWLKWLKNSEILVILKCIHKF